LPSNCGYFGARALNKKGRVFKIYFQVAGTSPLPWNEIFQWPANQRIASGPSLTGAAHCSFLGGALDTAISLVEAIKKNQLTNRHI